jgi:RNA polymerase sigma-70 factor (ECF subfamily)
VPAALPTFERRFLVLVPGFIGRIDSTPAFGDEVCQQLREKLFVAPAGSAPTIADYSGRGPLALWLRVVACRTALNLKRQRGDLPLADSQPERDPLWARSPDVELDYLR